MKGKEKHGKGKPLGAEMFVQHFSIQKARRGIQKAKWNVAAVHVVVSLGLWRLNRGGGEVLHQVDCVKVGKNSVTVQYSFFKITSVYF
jgi:hypothetical protein